MNIDTIVKSMREKINYKKICIEENDFLHKCILCKYYLSATEWAPLLEKYLKDMFKISKAKQSDEGDGISINNKKIEIKVSLGDAKGIFNFVQLRPDHDLDYYLIVCYNLYESTKGKIYMLLCNPNELYNLIPEYGHYAHGNIKKLGKITINNIKGRNLEYCLRPRLNNSKNINKSKKLWNELVQHFLSNENQINIAFGNKN